MRIIFAALCLFALQASADPIGFLAFGDSGKGNLLPIRRRQCTMKKFCQHEKCQFVTLLGDNIYPKGVEDVNDIQWEDKFREPYAPLNIPFFAALGNHDYLGNVQAEIDYTFHSTFWNMPSRYYTFTRGKVDFFVIDTNDFDVTQRAWLAKAITDSKATWKLVYGHHPIYSYGMHGDTAQLITELLPVLKGKVDLYLCGHDHDKQFLDGEGLPMLVSGTAAETRRVKKGPRTVFEASTLGFSHILIEDNRLQIRFLDKIGKVEFQKVLKK